MVHVRDVQGGLENGESLFRGEIIVDPSANFRGKERKSEIISKDLVLDSNSYKTKDSNSAIVS